MRNTTSLTVLQQQYHLGRLSKKDLEGLIFQYLVNNFERYHVFDGNRERWIDFLSWLYPRLSRAVDSYREKGSSFDAYINTIVQLGSREYRIREADHYATEYVCWKTRAEEMELQDPEPEYGDKAAEILPLPGNSQTGRFSFSFLNPIILFLMIFLTG